MDRICEALNVVLSFAERDGGSLYISQVTITSDGKIANYRCKIKPTHYEKTTLADGSGSYYFADDLTIYSLGSSPIHNVVRTEYGQLVEV
ncbi:hypothetical protein BD779DRAFT_44450 [Infundibulicybe gibba]|nr:hypothetical protein BD779DRAFT_44450 [Infundibulicybe gibba]